VSGLSQPLQPWSWLLVPALICAIATIMLDAPARFGPLGLPEPVFAMVPAFAWAVIRPSVLGPFVVLLSGLFLDFFWREPLGMWALALLAAYTATLATRNLMVGQPEQVLWAWYAAVTVLAFLVAVVILTLESRNMPNLLGVIWQGGLTALMYPLARRLIERFENTDLRFR
jgi:rod shape-determining protein MreD